MQVRKLTNRREFLRLSALGAASAAIIAACAPAAPPTPTPAPAKPAEAPKPAAQPTPAPAKPAAAGEKVTITYWDWWAIQGTSPSAKMFEYLPKGFAEREPNITLNLQNVPFGEYFRKFLAAHAAGDVPDTMHCSVAWGRSFYDRQAIQALNDYQKTTPDLTDDKFLPGSLFQSQKAGMRYGVPGEGPDHHGRFYNMQHFEEAGIDPDREKVLKWTWNDFTEAAVKLARRDSSGKITRSGFLVSTPGAEMIAAFAGTAGGSFYNKTETGVAFNENNALADALNWHLELLKKASQPIGPERQDWNQFLQGTTSIVTNGPWAYISAKEGAPNMRWSQMLMPARPAPGGKLSTCIWNNMLVIPTKAKNKDAGWKLLTYWCGLDFMLKRLEFGRWMAPRKDFYDTQQYKDALKEMPVLANVPLASSVGTSNVFIEWDPINTVIQPIMEAVMLGDKKPEQGASEAVVAVNEVLAKAGYK